MRRQGMLAQLSGVTPPAAYAVAVKQAEPGNSEDWANRIKSLCRPDHISVGGDTWDNPVMCAAWFADKDKALAAVDILEARWPRCSELFEPA